MNNSTQGSTKDEEDKSRLYEIGKEAAHWGGGEQRGLSLLLNFSCSFGLALTYIQYQSVSESPVSVLSPAVVVLVRILVVRASVFFYTSFKSHNHTSRLATLKSAVTSPFVTLRRSLRWPGRGRVFGRGERDRVHRAPPGGRPGPSQREAAGAAPGLRHRPRRHRPGGAQGAQRLCQRQVRAREERRRRSEGLRWLTGDDTQNKQKEDEGRGLLLPKRFFTLQKNHSFGKGIKKKRKNEKETSLIVISVICISKIFTSSVCECSKHTPSP